MIKILALFSLLLMFTVSKINSYEVCEKHTYYDLVYEEQNCTNYCCGSCTLRYCCSDYWNRLDQKLCAAENCQSYYDSWGYYYESYSCNGRFCCGSCEYRYCCSTSFNRLNQTNCPTGPPSTKRTTTPYYYYYNNTLSTVLWIVFSTCSLLIIFFMVVACIRRQRRQQPTTIITNTSSSVAYPRSTTQPVNTSSGNNPANAPPYPRSAYVVADNTAYNFDMNKIYNTNANDDLPPSYDTLNMQQKKTDETTDL